MASHHFASMPSPRPTPAPEPSTQVITTSNTNQPSSNPSEQPDDSNLTRSQQLFGVATGIDVRALQIMESHEFHLFMDMRAEKVWQSFSMTPKGWVSAANEYNTRLQKLCMEKALPQPVNKNPLALLRKLGEIEPQLINRLLSNNFACESPHPILPMPSLSHFGISQRAAAIHPSGQGTAKLSLSQQSLLLTA